MANMRIDGSTIVTRDQVLAFCEDNKSHPDDIIDLCIKYGQKYNVRYDIGFALCLLYTNLFHTKVDDFNICGLGLQMGSQKLEKFRSYEECIKLLFMMIRKFSDETFDEISDYEIYKLIDKPNVDFLMPDGFAGKITTVEELSKIWNSNMTGLRSASIEEFIYLMIQSFMAYNKNTIDFTNDRDVSFYVRLENHSDLVSATQMKRKLLTFSFIKNKRIPIIITPINGGENSNSKGYYVLDIGDFKYRGYAEGCQHNLKMFGYYGEVKYKPNDKFYINKNNTEDMK